VGWLWPRDWLPIAPGDHEQAFPTGRRAEVAGLDHLPLNHITHGFQQSHEAAPGAAALLRVRNQELLANRYNLTRCCNLTAELHDPAGGLVALGDQSAPLQDLFHVLQADHAGALHACPLEADPRQVAYLALARLTAGGL